MKNLATVIATATASAALTGCLATAPTTPDTNSGPNVPRAIATTPAASASAPVAQAAAKAATFQWNDESCNAELTENKIRQDKVCIRLVEGFAQTTAPVATAATPSRADTRKNAMPGTKTAGNTNTAPTVAAAPTTTAKIDANKPQTVYTLKADFSECGITAGNVTGTAGNVLGGLGSVLGGLGTTVGNAVKQGANRAAGGGIAGRAAGEATGAVVTPATQTGQRTVNDKQTAVATACSTQITNFINGDFKSAITALSNDFTKTHAGAKPAYTITSELPKAYEANLKAVVGEPTVSVRAPR